MSTQIESVRRFRITSEEMTAKDLIGFYDMVADKLGEDSLDPNLRYNCNSIAVAANVLERFHVTYRQKFPDLAERYGNIFDTEINMILARSGPGVKKDLPDDTVEVQDGFFHYTEEQ